MKFNESRRNYMPIRLDATDFENEDDAQYTSGELLAAGTYHVVVDEVEDKFDTHEQIIFTFKALAGTTPGEEGKTRKAFFDFREDLAAKKDPAWKSNRSKLQLAQLWMSLGLLKPHGEIDCDPAAAVGLECMALFSESKKTDKTGKPFVNFERSYALDNAEVGSVPRGSVSDVAAPAAAETTGGDGFDDL